MEKITVKNPKNVLLPHPHVAPNELAFTVDSLSDVSDGYHTIEQLYDHRITLFIALCRNFDLLQETDLHPHGYLDVWRSKTHHDGSSWDGWFIMGIGKEKGEQISYHIPLSRWDETDFAETLEMAPPWDGHTSQDVLERLKNL